MRPDHLRTRNITLRDIADHLREQAELPVAAFTAWRVPTPWQTRPYGVVDHGLVDLLTGLLRRTDRPAADRCRLAAALAAELDGEADPRGTEAGREAMAIGSSTGDPELVALGLSARLRTMSYDREAAGRHELALRLRAFADEHSLVIYRWFADEVLGSSAAVLGDQAEVRAVVERQATIVRAYRLNEALAINLGARAALAHIAGDFETAQHLYDQATDQLHRQGSMHAGLYHYYATASLLLSQGRITELEAATRAIRPTAGPVLDDLLALTSGRDDDRRLGTHAYLPDYFRTGQLTFRACAILALGRRDLARPLIDALLPAHDQLAGFASISITLRPVALTLGELYRLVGDEPEADRYLRHAITVAERWQSQHWLAEARAARTHHDVRAR
jgi:hypothetical protein